MGPNIRTGSHYTQFLFYDFNGDGRAELICKTAPESIDGVGQYVTEAADDEVIKTADNTADYRNSQGRILSGPEYLTVFDGLSGRALHTIWYSPNRAFLTGRASNYTDEWGDDYGNRGERFLACAAHLDGTDHPASAIFTRGYYTRAYLWAVDFDGAKLSTRWLHASLSKSRVSVTDAAGKTITTTYSSNTSGVGDLMPDRSLRQQTAEKGTDIIPVEGRMLRCNTLSAYRTLLDGKTEKFIGVPNGFTFSYDKATMNFRLEGAPEKTGLYQIILRTSGNPLGVELTDTISINVTEPTGIWTMSTEDLQRTSVLYNLQGVRVKHPGKGIYIRNGRKYKY